MQIQIRNQSPLAPATGATATLLLGPSLTLARLDPTFSTSGTTGAITFQLGTLSPWAHLTIAATVQTSADVAVGSQHLVAASVDLLGTSSGYYSKIVNVVA